MNIWFCPHLLMFFSFHFSVWKKVFSDSFRYWATQILEQFTNGCINLATVRFVTTYVFIETDLGKSQKPFIWLGLIMLDNQITSSKNVAVKENVLSNYTVTLSSVYISTRCLLMCNIQNASVMCFIFSFKYPANTALLYRSVYSSGIVRAPERERETRSSTNSERNSQN